jgi:hypothetical protein
MAEEMFTPEAPNGTDVTPAALAAVAVSLVTGCAVQAMSDPEGFDTASYLAAVQHLLGRLAASPSA